MLARPALMQLYEIAGRRVLVATEDEWCGHAVSTQFDGWFLKPLPLNGAGSNKLVQDALISIKLGEVPPLELNKFAKFELAFGGVGYTDGQHFQLDFEGSSVIFGPGLSHQVDIWLNQTRDLSSSIFTQIISQAFSAALRRRGLFEFPSAGVMPPAGEQAVLIAGESGTGKSTLTLQLAANGWRYLSDDTLLLEHTEAGLAAHALRKFFAVTSDTFQAIHLPYSIKSTPSFKARIIPQDLFPLGQVPSAKPGAIVFTRLAKSSETKIHKLRPSEAMTRLLRLCPWAAYDKPTAVEHLGLLGQLAQQCKTFNLLAGFDILEDRSRAAKIMDEVLTT